MIVKIFPPVNGFPAVRYNTGKMDRNAGELMKVANFGVLQGLGTLGPGDYQRYFKQLAALNKGISHPQLHAAISAESRTADKYQLAKLAEQWLEAMGYGKQPYLLVFHRDTNNNHIHLVSCRLDRNGKKISSAFEYRRSMAIINRLTGLDESLTAQKDLKDALSYRFSGRAQLAMILESKGYVIRENELIKYGRKLLVIEPDAVHFNEADARRVKQLKAILEKYRQKYAAELLPATIPLPEKLQKATGQYHSELGDMLKAKFGIELVFHASQGKPPYGYSVIDHAGKNVFKGSEVMALKELLQPLPAATKQWNAERPAQTSDHPLPAPGAAVNEAARQESFPGSGPETEADRLGGVSSDVADAEAVLYEAPVRINIADDIDDEAILGRNRRRKKTARTNTR